MRERPTPGQIVEREIVVAVCGTCGYTIDADMSNMCDYDCPYDGADERPKVIHAFYKRTDVFLRDELEEKRLDISE